MKKLFIVLLAMGIAEMMPARTTDVLKADFTGTNIDNVYQVVTKLGCHTTFELPSNKRIKHFIIGDQKLWKAESDGKYAFVKPIQNGIETTITIVTTDDAMFQFTVAEKSSIGETDFHKKVKILFEDEAPMIAPAIKSNEISEVSLEEVRHEVEQKMSRQKTSMLKNLDNKFRIKKNVFGILNVFQDGVFTYIDLSKTQIRPAVFLVNKRDKAKMEPVNFTDEEGIFTIHRVLGKDDFFLLKNGMDYTQISKR